MFADSQILTKVVCCHQFFYSRATLFLVENLKSVAMPKETTPFYLDSNWLSWGALVSSGFHSKK